METIYYGTKGQEIDKPAQNFEYRACAKKVKGEHTIRYFIATANGVLMDPKTLNESQMKSYSHKMREVGYEVFDKYIAYLSNDSSRLSINSIDRMI